MLFCVRLCLLKWRGLDEQVNKTKEKKISNLILIFLRTMQERRKILEEHIKEIPGRVMLSEQKLIKVMEKKNFFFY